MSDEEDNDSQFDEEDSDEGLVEMSEDDSDDGMDEDGDQDGDEDDSDGSEDGGNDDSNEGAPGGYDQPYNEFTYPTSRASSPTLQRRGLFTTTIIPRSYTIEPIVVLPHPEAIHAIAASTCLSHFTTGSEDGFIRNYNIFESANGKALLTAPQRSHVGLQDSNLKSGVLRSWWQNSISGQGSDAGGAIPTGLDVKEQSPIYSMVLQADALWGLAGTKAGPITLYTVRHDPGTIHHVLRGHQGAVSSMCLTHDEAGLLSAAWDGNALHWDLNTGQIARSYPSHGAQLTTIAMRPLGAPLPVVYNPYAPNGVTAVMPGAAFNPADVDMNGGDMAPPTYELDQHQQFDPNAMTNGNQHFANGVPPMTNGAVNGHGHEIDGSADSDNGYDPLFDDEDGEASTALGPLSAVSAPNGQPQFPNLPPTVNGATAPQAVPLPSSAPLQMPGAAALPSYSTANGATNGGGLWGQNAYHNQNYGAQQNPYRVPLLDPVSYSNFSPDIFMTAGIDGQITLWDRRVSSMGMSGGRGVGRLELGEKTPPWCISACWSADGAHIMAGRRNGNIEIYDVRKYGPASGQGQPKIFKVLRNPSSSGPVSCLTAFPDRQHVACASQDNIRLWNLGIDEPDTGMAKRSGSAPFKIIAGHHGAISQIMVDASSKFMISASGNRGWWGDSSKSVMVHSIAPVL